MGLFERELENSLILNFPYYEGMNPDGVGTSILACPYNWRKQIDYDLDFLKKTFVGFV